MRSLTFAREQLALAGALDTVLIQTVSSREKTPQQVSFDEINWTAGESGQT
jgi:hypothetical protein